MNLFSFVCILSVSLVNINCVNNSNFTHNRSRRFLHFLDKSRIIFRVNVKNNILAINQILAHAYGFRTNSPINTNTNNPPDSPSKKPSKKPAAGKRREDTNAYHVVKRSYIFKNLEDLMNLHGFDGRACVLKSFCEAKDKADPQTKTGMLFKLFQLIFSLQEKDRKHFSYLRDENCGQLLHQHCPLSFNSLSPYTDDI